MELQLELALEALSGQHLSIHTAPRRRTRTRTRLWLFSTICPSGGDSIDPAAQSSRWRSRTRRCTTWPRNRRRPSDSSRASRCVLFFSAGLAQDTVDRGQRFPIPTEFALLLSRNARRCSHLFSPLPKTKGRNTLRLGLLTLLMLSTGTVCRRKDPERCHHPRVRKGRSYLYLEDHCSSPPPLR